MKSCSSSIAPLLLLAQLCCARCRCSCGRGCSGCCPGGGICCCCHSESELTNCFSILIRVCPKSTSSVRKCSRATEARRPCTPACWLRAYTHAVTQLGTRTCWVRAPRCVDRRCLVPETDCRPALFLVRRVISCPAGIRPVISLRVVAGIRLPSIETNRQLDHSAVGFTVLPPKRPM